MNHNEADTQNSDQDIVRNALVHCKKAFQITFFIAFCINFLMLLTPLYSLQVLDRVIGTGSMETLLWLSVIIAFIYFAYGLLQIARSFTLIKIGEWLDTKITPVLFAHSIATFAKNPRSNPRQIMQDFAAIKGFMTSMGINTLFDAPWSIIYFIVVFMIHPYIGWIALIGAILIVSLGFINAAATNRVLGEATEFNIKSHNSVDIAARNAEVIEAMGMMKAVSHNWFQLSQSALNKQSTASYRNGILSNIVRFIRHLMQMAVTGTGAYLVVRSSGTEMSTGGMIASSIIVGKALAPFDNAIEIWKQITNTLKAYQRIKTGLAHSDLRDKAMPIPTVDGSVHVENVSYHPPLPPATGLAALMGQPKPKMTLSEVDFKVEPGELIAVLGPSGSGKTTLAKIMMGIWKPVDGRVMVDKYNIYDWNRHDVGNHIGYMPQDIGLFSGTVKDNIARMNQDADPEKVIEAAKLAGAHDIITSFPKGYDTDIGMAGTSLSGGQRQRVALARAFYNNPKVVVLDEPNANLDQLGEQNLNEAFLRAKEKNITIIVVSHRPSILSVVDKVLILQQGKIVEYGSRDEILKKLNMQNSKA